MMLTSPTMEKLRELKLSGMVKALEEQNASDNYKKLSFDERLGYLVDNEKLIRDNKRTAGRIRQAKLKQQACIEDIDIKAQRGLDRSMILSLAKCQWIKEHHDIIITGLTGVGKTYIACAFAHRACLEGYKTMYKRLPRLIEELSIARADGTYPKLLERISKMDLLVIDDWGLFKLESQQARDFLEIIEDRYELRSTIISSQVPVKEWHQLIENSTVADAILDRLVHGTYRIEMKGESLRKNKKKTKDIKKGDE